MKEQQKSTTETINDTNQKTEKEELFSKKFNIDYTTLFNEDYAKKLRYTCCCFQYTAEGDKTFYKGIFEEAGKIIPKNTEEFDFIYFAKTISHPVFQELIKTYTGNEELIIKERKEFKSLVNALNAVAKEFVSDMNNEPKKVDQNDFYYKEVMETLKDKKQPQVFKTFIKETNKQLSSQNVEIAQNKQKNGSILFSVKKAEPAKVPTLGA